MYPKPALLVELGFAIIRARFGKLFGRSSKKAEPSSADGQSFPYLVGQYLHYTVAALLKLRLSSCSMPTAEDLRLRKSSGAGMARLETDANHPEVLQLYCTAWNGPHYCPPQAQQTPEQTQQPERSCVDKYLLRLSDFYHHSSGPHWLSRLEWLSRHLSLSRLHQLIRLHQAALQAQDTQTAEQSPLTQHSSPPYTPQ